MPVFNGERYLAEAVWSVLGQSMTDLELVAVDDGSQDGSRRALEGFARADARVRLVSSGEHVGIAAALNLGLRAARCEYVARADADDVALPERLARQVAFLDAHPSVAAVGSAVRTIGAAGSSGPVIRVPTESSVIRLALLRQNCMVHPSIMLRRSAVAAVGGYRFDCVEDYDLWLRLSEPFELANLKEPLLLYRVHPGQLSLRRLEEIARMRLVVRAAARARSAGCPDPLAGVRELTQDILATANVGERDVARAVEADWVARVALGAELNSADAQGMIDEASRALGRRARHLIAAGREFIRAEACLASHRPLAVLAHLVRAFAHDPLYSSARLASWMAKRVRRPLASQR